MASPAVNRPAFTLKEVAALAKERYGFEGHLASLPSDRDQNFLLGRPSRDSEALVLKIANGDERRDFLTMQDALITHVGERWASGGAGGAPFPLPRSVTDRAGAVIGTVESGDGRTFLTRAVTYLPGVPLAGVRPRHRLLRSWGQALGRLDHGLADFEHPAATRSFDWDPRTAPAIIRERIGSIEDSARRSLVRAVMERCEERLGGLGERLRTQVVHGDPNDYNILVNAVADVPADGRYGDREVVGIIDFGDTVHTWLAAEPAIAGAYAMLSKSDPVGALAAVVGGFHETFPLTEEEIAALFPFSCLRLCLSATMSAFQRAREPENEYLSISESQVWELLEGIDALDPDLAHYRLREACGAEPCPAAETLRSWLAEKAEAGAFAQVVVADFAHEPLTVFDLSIGSTELGVMDGDLDASAWTELLFGRMHSEGAQFGIGRYDEPRRWYDSSAYATPREDGPEWRTIHIGIDVFADPGTPVHAPFAGRVHSFQDNDAQLDYGPTILLRHEGSEATGEWFTLYGHLSRDSLAGLHEGTSFAAGDEIGRIGPFPENGDWAPHLHFQVITDLLGSEGDFPGVALASQRAVWLSLSPDPNLVLGIPGLEPGAGGCGPAELLRARGDLLGPSLSVSYRTPLKIVRGKGAYLLDHEGASYLDCVNNIAHVGHCHPRVVRAGQGQMAVLNTNTRYLHDSLVTFAGRLAATLPDPLEVCFFVCTGSEANELALRMARAHTGERDVIVVEGGYHGNTSSLIDVSSYKFDGPGGSGAPPWVSCMPMPDPYRGRYRAADPECGARYAQDVGRAVEELVGKGRRPAAFMSESILSCGGQIVLPEGYLQGVYEHVRSAGGVCVADEVQVGFGRVGSSFWAFETQGVVPDIVTMGKPIGNGHPLAAVVSTAEIAASFDNGMEYFNSFGGNPVSCEIGLAVLDVIEDEELQRHARRVGQRLRSGLERLAGDHPIIGDVRGMGLFQGIELVVDPESLAPAAEHATYLVDRMCEKGFLLSTDGPLHNVVKIKPPMVFDEGDADSLVAGLDIVLAEDALRLEV